MNAYIHGKKHKDLRFFVRARVGALPQIDSPEEVGLINCTSYFGKSPYDEIYITEQPNFNFGQSWPNLVYLPISAYTDSTQRWLLFGKIDPKFEGFCAGGNAPRGRPSMVGTRR